MAITRTEHASGLRVITERMPGVRSVALGFWALAGSRDEPPPISGSSHFLEHLLFKGTKTRSAKDIAEAFDAVGGDVNAFTSKEYTCFYCRVLDRDLEMAVDHLTDMLQRSVIREPDFRSEKQVILEEINVHEDTPDDLVHDLFTETLWPEHPLGRPILGTKGSIDAATRDQVRRYWKKHYTPANLIVVAAGNLRHEDLLAYLRRGIEVGRAVGGRSAANGRNTRSHDVVAPKPSGRSITRKRDTEQAHICIGTNGLARDDADRFAFGVVNAALGGGMSSRLFQEIREKRGLAYSAYSYHSQYAEAGLFCAYSGTTPAKAKEVVAIMRGQLEDVAENGLAPDEFERAKGHMKGSLVLGLEDPGGRMSRLGKSEIGHGEILSVSQVLRRIDAVTVDDAKRVADRVLAQPMTTTVLGPFGKDITR
jgi:predicted Zn-dependent peptidase